jgi:futalosine hydrolase
MWREARGTIRQDSHRITRHPSPITVIMIALLAAVSEETRLIRQSCPELHCVEQHGLAIWQGQCDRTPICLAHSGIGKAAAATAATTLLLTCSPRALCLFGCGGAYPSSGLSIGDLALADLEIFGDEGVETTDGFRTLVEMDLAMRHSADGPYFNAWPTDDRLTTWAEETLQGLLSPRRKRLAKGPFITVSTCTGTAARARELSARTRVICENMEGAAVALACRQVGIPFLELRGISNIVEKRDTTKWNLAAGMSTAQKALLDLLAAWPEA